MIKFICFERYEMEFISFNDLKKFIKQIKTNEKEYVYQCCVDQSVILEQFDFFEMLCFAQMFPEHNDEIAQQFNSASFQASLIQHLSAYEATRFVKHFPNYEQQWLKQLSIDPIFQAKQRKEYLASIMVLPNGHEGMPLEDLEALFAQSIEYPIHYNWSINFLWIPPAPVPSGKLPIPNTHEAPFIANMNAYARWNSTVIVNLYIQRARIETNDDFFDDDSLENLRKALDSNIHIKIMDQDFYETSLKTVYENIKYRNDCNDIEYNYWSNLDTLITEQLPILFASNSVYLKIDLIRLLILDRELRTGKTFAMYVDLDIVLPQSIENIFFSFNPDIIVFNIPNAKRQDYWAETGVYGFVPNRLPYLYKLFIKMAIKICENNRTRFMQGNGFMAFDKHVINLHKLGDKSVLNLYASEAPPNRVSQMNDAIQSTFQNSEQAVIQPGPVMPISTLSILKRDCFYQGITKPQKNMNQNPEEVCNLVFKSVTSIDKLMNLMTLVDADGLFFNKLSKVDPGWHSWFLNNIYTFLELVQRCGVSFKTLYELDPAVRKLLLDNPSSAVRLFKHAKLSIATFLRLDLAGMMYLINNSFALKRLVLNVGITSETLFAFDQDVRNELINQSCAMLTFVNEMRVPLNDLLALDKTCSSNARSWIS